MTVNRKKKSSKIRGSQTYGWGKKSRHRGAGNHSGRGRCGLGKRGHCKKPTMLKLRSVLGLRRRTKVGFNRHFSVIKDMRIISIATLVASMDQLLAENKVKKEKDMIVVNLRELGYNKLLSNGKLDMKLKISADYFSKKAAEKVKASGGETFSFLQPIEKPAEEKQE